MKSRAINKYHTFVRLHFFSDFTMVNSDWHEGGCFCGAVRFRVRGDAIWKNGCASNSCVKSHGAPYVVWAGFDRSNHEIIQGSLSAYRSKPNVIREFCPGCGSTLSYGKDAVGDKALAEAASIIYIAVANLDDPGHYPPDEVVHGLEKIEWFHLGGDIPVRDFTSPSCGHLQFGGIKQPQTGKS